MVCNVFAAIFQSNSCYLWTLDEFLTQGSTTHIRNIATCVFSVALLNLKLVVTFEPFQSLVFRIFFFQKNIPCVWFSLLVFENMLSLMSVLKSLLKQLCDTCFNVGWHDCLAMYQLTRKVLTTQMALYTSLLKSLLDNKWFLSEV